MSFHFSLKATLVALALTIVPALAADPIKVGALEITGPFTRATLPGAQVGAGFMTITNTGKEEDRLVKATASITSTVQLHEMKMEGDVMKMSEVPGGIVIPPGATVELKPKSLHVMFMDLKAPVKEGETITGTLTFEKAGTVDVDYDVMAPNAGMD